MARLLDACAAAIDSAIELPSFPLPFVTLKVGVAAGGSAVPLVEVGSGLLVCIHWLVASLNENHRFCAVALLV